MDGMVSTISITAAVSSLLVLIASVIQDKDEKEVDRVEVVNARMYSTSKALPEIVFVAGGPQHFKRPILSKGDGGQAGATAVNYKLSAAAFDDQYFVYDKGYLKGECGYCIHKFKDTYFVIVVASATDAPDKWTNLARDLEAAFNACKKLNSQNGKDPKNPVWVPLFGNGAFSTSRQADSIKSQGVVVDAARKSGLYVTVYTG